MPSLCYIQNSSLGLPSLSYSLLFCLIIFRNIKSLKIERKKEKKDCLFLNSSMSNRLAIYDNETKDQQIHLQFTFRDGTRNNDQAESDR
jgi:hypothetical protein